MTATAMWTERIGNDNIVRRKVPGDDVRLAVLKVPETITYRDRSLSKGVESTESIESQHLIGLRCINALHWPPCMFGVMVQ